ncbi:MAG: DUF192 domain-containing protein [Rhodospirillaceae bacterium]|jgi:uncharacterized protein|nr:DUF192 domain-containing protein [Rhodospirillaceae bacterium]MBT3925460.1 DUF192 domain-containing protein [Rhodospirillaceae bacterium]MBT5038040.1 DUF192 domain-containing protein [Rhodospirillaceae bacterium]MBT5676149.1 DUF192 domain-containing protein [Rhodospirillaceae bacterium]MBT5779142.1 DUF192 domain-containing protein [Rhodospirillaceae bacterium]
MRFYARLLVAVFVLCATVWLSAPLQAQQELPLEPLAIETAAGKRLFQVEVARTKRQQAVGLMWRSYMAADHGMLFDMGEPRHITMWMKNTPLSLDMLFIKRDGTVVSIASHTKPFSTDRISSGVKVSAVLELLAGSAERLGIAPGDLVRHSLLGSPP